MESHIPRYLTTTLPYVNADPHVGFALEIVQADVLARHWRMRGHEVFFNTGTDEHGQKILRKAEEAGEDVQAYVDHYAAQFENLKSALNLSYDAFIRTTNAEHVAAAQHMWRICAENGDIYKKTYKGLYCVGCEAYIKESELVDGTCPQHPNQKPQEIEEENYFFKLSAYEKQIRAYLENPSVVVPEWRRKEALSFVEEGLEDFSISREKERMRWGVPVPEDDTQVMYVWFDALTNYISTLDWPEDRAGNFKKFWKDGHTLQLAGKDQVRFQSIMWQGMLMSAGIPTTDSVLYHGFINSGGQKMSKSIGNVISPFELTEKYGTDGARYILLRHVHPTDDTDLTWERMDEWYTANLANGLGNLAARVLKMAETHLSEIPCSTDEDVANERRVVMKKHTAYQRFFDEYRFSNVLDEVWELIGKADGYIERYKPFALIKEDRQHAEFHIKHLVIDLAHIAILLEPFLPETSDKILAAIKCKQKPETLFPRLDEHTT